MAFSFFSGWHTGGKSIFLVNAEYDETKGQLTVSAYTTSVQKGAQILLTLPGENGRQEKVLYEETSDLSPEETYEVKIDREKLQQIPTFAEGEQNGTEVLCGLRVCVCAADGRELVSYHFPKKIEAEVPEPAKAAPLPEDCETTEDLFLYGLHVEQYRHATYHPEDYYLEGLRRDPTDIRLNNAYGRCLLKKCDFTGAEKYFRKAVEKSIRSNPNPYDYEPYYNLGLSLKYQGKEKEAYDVFYKAIWGGSFQAPGLYELACLDAKAGRFAEALEHVNESILRQYQCMKARALKENILRKLGRVKEAEELHKESLKIDPLYDRQPEKINHNTLLELVIDLYEAGDYAQGITLAEKWVEQQNVSRQEDIYPLVYYYIAYGYQNLYRKENTKQTNHYMTAYVTLGENAVADGCFPHRTEDYIVLKSLADDYYLDMVYYYMGCLLYDRRAYGEAIADYEEAALRYPDFPTVHRNLALAYYNVKKQPQRAYEEMEKAFALDETDSRVYLELDQLKKRLNVPVKERWSDMEKHFDLVESRDDLYLEYVTLLNTLGESEKALNLIKARKFHQWEGGEGKVAAQYLTALYQLAKAAAAEGEYVEAKTILLQAVDEYPQNLGEGKLESAQENNLHYLLGLVQEKLGETEEAFASLTKACHGESEPVGMMYYNDQPPEMIYYQGLAYRALGDEEQAVERFRKLEDYGKKHIGDEIKIDYFAVSLPDLLIFEENLDERNRKHCLFMMSLGLKGLGRSDEAEKCAEELLAMDNAHQEIRVHDL